MFPPGISIAYGHKIFVKFCFLTRILYMPCYNEAEMKGVIKLFHRKKAMIQGALLRAAICMVCFGAMRGEVDSVFSKAIRLCLECVGIG